MKMRDLKPQVFMKQEELKIRQTMRFKKLGQAGLSESRFGLEAFVRQIIEPEVRGGASRRPDILYRYHGATLIAGLGISDSICSSAHHQDRTRSGITASFHRRVSTDLLALITFAFNDILKCVNIVNTQAPISAACLRIFSVSFSRMFTTMKFRSQGTLYHESRGIIILELTSNVP
jgi:hypothetical protein